MNPRSRQRGVALITAILLVAIATILAATIAFQGAMAARRGAASLAFDRSVLVAEGAEALAAYALQQDSNSTDDPTDPWGQPFGPLEIAPGVVLEATLQDLNGRFNLNGLIRQDGSIDPDQLAIFQRLLEWLKMDTKWANQIADWIDSDSTETPPGGLEDAGTTTQQPPYRTANAFITSTSELLALPGFGRERYLQLAPYVVALPPDAMLNVCTTSPELLDAMLGPGQQEYVGSPLLVDTRKTTCYPKYTQYKGVLEQRHFDSPTYLPNLTTLRLAERSQYFRLTSIVTIGGTEFALYSLLWRENTGGIPTGKVRVLQRSFTPD